MRNVAATKMNAFRVDSQALVSNDYHHSASPFYHLGTGQILQAKQGMSPINVEVR